MNLSALNIGYRCSCYSTRFCLNAIKILLFFVTISSGLLAVINADNGDEGLLGGLLGGALKGLGGGVGNLLDGKVDVVGSTVDLLNDAKLFTTKLNKKKGRKWTAKALIRFAILDVPNKKRLCGVKGRNSPNMASTSPSAKKKAPRAGKNAPPLPFTDKITTINPTTSKLTPTTTEADSNVPIGPILDPILAPSSANRSAAGGHLTSVKLFETKGNGRGKAKNNENGEAHGKGKRRKRRSTNETLPTSFDTRIKWSECAFRIGIINDQGNCGSCWAIATAQMIQDRLCIAQLAIGIRPVNNTILQASSMDFMTCSNALYDDIDGCNGGWPKLAAIWAAQYRVVSGSGLPYSAYCMPYSENAYQNGTCERNCPYECTNRNFSESYKSAKEMLGNGNGLHTWHLDNDTATHTTISLIDQIKWELFNNGPVVATMETYLDLYYFSSGIYQKYDSSWDPQSKYFMGYHAVRIVEWGQGPDDNGEMQDYWVVANTWGPNWGENGFFKILMGTCGIDSISIDSLSIDANAAGFTVPTGADANSAANAQANNQTTDGLVGAKSSGFTSSGSDLTSTTSATNAPFSTSTNH